MSFSAPFSAGELSVMKAAGACRSRRVHKEAGGFGGLILDRLPGAVAPCKVYFRCQIKNSEACKLTSHKLGKKRFRQFQDKAYACPHLKKNCPVNLNL